MSVAQFATELKMPAAALLEQLQKAGVSKQASDDTLTEADKARLLEYLRKSHGETDAKSKITLTRKQTSEIKAADSTGKSRTIQVEVRKKRVLVRRDTPDAAADAAELAPVAEAPVVEAPPVVEVPVVEAPPVIEVAPPVVEAAPEPVPEPAPVVEPEAPAVVEAPVAAEPVKKPKSKEPVLVRRSVIDAEQQAIRDAEARRAAELAAIQAAEKKAKQERDLAAREREEAARKAAAAPPAAPTGTLHKPAKATEAKPDAKTDKPGAKKPGSSWSDDAAKRRGGL
ncbi:MAG TPA: translation initiation factor IF-2 associated domain-containing protein, partial [Rhodocyclaceae bacterium]|nr:translation initiation factor IF-2 associated domain-containing protein [Rhodocyclaceae bacterium]